LNKEELKAVEVCGQSDGQLKNWAMEESCPYKKQIEEDEMFDCPFCSNETCDYYVDHTLDDD